MELFVAFLVILTIGSISYLLMILCQNTFLYIYDSGRNVVHNTVILKTPQHLDKTFVLQKKKEVFKDNGGKKIVFINPNPTSSALKIEIKGCQRDLTTGAYLYDYSGKLLQTKNTADHSFSLDLSTYLPGIYIMKIVLGDCISDWKIIKE